MTHAPGEDRVERIAKHYAKSPTPFIREDVAFLVTRLREVEGEKESARKALREIGERTIVDWQDELVGLVSVGLGTTDWDSVTTMEKHVVDAERALRRDVQDKLAKAEQRVAGLEAVVDTFTSVYRRVMESAGKLDSDVWYAVTKAQEKAAALASSQNVDIPAQKPTFGNTTPAPRGQ